MDLTNLSFVSTEQLVRELQRRFPAQDDGNGPPQHRELAALVERPLRGEE